MKEEDKQYLSQVGMYLADLFYNQNNMKQIPTAEEFIQNFLMKNHKGNIGSNTELLMIEFAKLHVEAALKHASEKAEISNKPKFSGDYNLVIDEDSILNSYPLENIK